MQFHEKLVQLRKRRGLTQAQAAELVDTSRQAISKWESGTGVPALENIKALARVYGVSFDTLLDDSRDLEDETAPSPQTPAEGPAARQPRPSNKRRPAMAGAATAIYLMSLPRSLTFLRSTPGTAAAPPAEAAGSDSPERTTRIPRGSLFRVTYLREDTS